MIKLNIQRILELTTLTLISFGCCAFSSWWAARLVVRLGFTVAFGLDLSSQVFDSLAAVSDIVFVIAVDGCASFRTGTFVWLAVIADAAAVVVVVVVAVAAVILTVLLAGLLLITDVFSDDAVSCGAGVLRWCSVLPFCWLWWCCTLLFADRAPANLDVTWLVNGSGMITIGSSSMPPLLSLSSLRDVSLRFDAAVDDVDDDEPDDVFAFIFF